MDLRFRKQHIEIPKRDVFCYKFWLREAHEVMQNSQQKNLITIKSQPAKF